MATSAASPTNRRLRPAGVDGVATTGLETAETWETTPATEFKPRHDTTNQEIRFRACRSGGFRFRFDRIGERQAIGELARLQHPRHAIDRLERLDLVGTGRGLQFLEAARLDQNIAFERSHRLVVRLERRLETRAEGVEVRAEH